MDAPGHSDCCFVCVFVCVFIVDETKLLATEVKQVSQGHTAMKRRWWCWNPSTLVLLEQLIPYPNIIIMIDFDTAYIMAVFNVELVPLGKRDELSRLMSSFPQKREWHPQKGQWNPNTNDICNFEALYSSQLYQTWG